MLFYNKKIKNLFIDFARLNKAYGFSYAFYNFIWWLCFYLRFPRYSAISRFCLNKKTAFLERYIEKIFPEIIEKFQKHSPTQYLSCDRYRIWFFWGQGEKAMPPLVHSCYRQLLKFHPQETVLVTNDNLSEYIKLPQEIYQKVYSGAISWAQFSDIVRNTLLAQYGGLWLDSTVWITRALPIEKLSRMILFSANGGEISNNAAVSVHFWTSIKWSWSSWCLGANVLGYSLYCFVSKMMQILVQTKPILPDYVVQDFLIYYALRHFPDIAGDLLLSQTICCKRRNELADLMGQPYREEIYTELIKNETVFKLSYKHVWPTHTPDGRITFWGKILLEPDSLPL